MIIACLALIATGCASDENLHRKNLISWHHLQWKNVKAQQYDYSCGAGALSTLIEYYFEDPAPEHFILEDMIGRLDQHTLDDRKEVGFSMQDLKIQAESMGYFCAGIKMTPEMLFDLKGPVIVLLEGEKINHFVVLKGASKGKIFLADPRRGNIRMSLNTFISRWSGRLALVLGKKGFGLPTDYLLGISQTVAATNWVPPEYDSWRMTQQHMERVPQKTPRMNFTEAPIQ